MTSSLSDVIKKLTVVFLIVAGLYFGQEFLIPLCIGAVLATVFLPFCNWMERKKIPKAVTVLLSLFVLLSIIFVLLSLVGFQVAEIVSDVAVLKQKAIESGTKIQKYIFDTLNLSVKEQNIIFKSEKPSYATMVQAMLGSMTTFLSSIILILVYFVFLLYYRNHIKNFLVQLVPVAQRDEMSLVIQKIATVSQQYLIGLSKMIFLLWIMYGIGFSMLGIENAIFFAILCGILEIVPFIGNLTGTFLTVVVAAMNGANTNVLIGIIIVYGVVQFIQGWILEPLIVGAQVKINSLFTIMALIVFEILWGIPGVILAIPLTAMFKIVCDYVTPLKPYGFLIGEIAVAPKENVLVNKIKKIAKTKASNNEINN
ncbi:MAG: AI-2E family transporter [Flavobacterium sp.]|nr:AI-2E family transporter [Flavobacterium sp.]